MADLISADRPDSVLDYGCGDGRLAEELTVRGIHVTGYDPDSSMISKCMDLRRQDTCGDRNLLERLLGESVKFNVVVCGRVLCTIADKGEFGDVLADIRRLVSDSGTVLVAVCNPFHLSTESTELWQKQLPTGFEYQDTFVYDKTVAASRNTRREVHRSHSTYQRAFVNAGFHVEDVIELEGTDTGALLPSSDHLVFRLEPAPMDGPRVSLLIKTCAMEWRTIERQVRHLVEQMETPLRFVERVVVVDTYAGPFARQYDEPDPEAHQARDEDPALGRRSGPRGGTRRMTRQSSEQPTESGLVRNPKRLTLPTGSSCSPPCTVSIPALATTCSRWTATFW